MRIYTGTGDDGETGLFGGSRVFKNDARIEAYGTIDELNAALGVARAAEPPEAVDQLLEAIQNDLFDLGAELASPDPVRQGTLLIGPDQVAALEAAIDGCQEQLPALKQFILPAGTPAASWLHLARAVCRRAERRLLTLYWAQPAPTESRALVYLNRLGDLLFVLSRTANAAQGRDDVPWRGRPSR